MQMIGVSLPWDLLLRLTLLSLSLPFVPRPHLLQSRLLHPPVILIPLYLRFCCCYSFRNQCSHYDGDILVPTVSRERSGTVIARNFWDFSGQKDQIVASVILHHAQRSTDLFNATVVDQHAGRPSSSHSIQPSATAGNSPTHSTETLRPRLVP